MNGQMIEARLQRVDWSDVSVDTFARLCEFAYLQNYTPPKFQQSPHFSSTSPGSQKNISCDADADAEHVPGAESEYEVEDEPEPEPKPPAPESEVDMNGTIHAFKVPLEQRNIFKKDLQGAFEDLKYFPPKSAYEFTPKSNEGPTQDFTAVLVGHVELYIIADKYGIEPLRQLVLHKLHQTLKSFTVYETDVVCIAEFLRFVYQNTPSDNGKMDPLRDLTSRYVVFILGKIGDIEAFKQLLVEGGDFVIDFWHLIWTADIPSRPHARYYYVSGSL